MISFLPFFHLWIGIVKENTPFVESMWSNISINHKFYYKELNLWIYSLFFFVIQWLGLESRKNTEIEWEPTLFEFERRNNKKILFPDTSIDQIRSLFWWISERITSIQVMNINYSNFKPKELPFSCLSKKGFKKNFAGYTHSHSPGKKWREISIYEEYCVKNERQKKTEKLSLEEIQFFDH